MRTHETGEKPAEPSLADCVGSQAVYLELWLSVS